VVPARGVTFALQTNNPTESYAVALKLPELSLLLSWYMRQPSHSYLIST